MPQTQRPRRTYKKPIEVGQVWNPQDSGRHTRRLRVVCRYPFADAGDGPLWVVEHVSVMHFLERIPESTLRALYRLDPGSA
jgi:hypothetical protein